VARERGSGDYLAIQCKFYDPAHTLQKANIDSFFTASGKCFETADGERSFSQRLIVATTDKWSKHAEQALKNQTIPATRLWFKDLAASPVDLSQFSLAKIEDMQFKGKKAPYPHQAEAYRLYTGTAQAAIPSFDVVSFDLCSLWVPTGPQRRDLAPRHGLGGIYGLCAGFLTDR